MPYHHPTMKGSTIARHNLLELVGMCKLDAISTTNHSCPVAMNAKAGNYQGSGSENHVRQDFGTPLDAGPGSFSTIKFGKLPCPFGTNSCAARVPNPVQMVAGQSPVRPDQHFCTIRPGPLQGIGGDVPTRRIQILLLALCLQQWSF